MNPRRLNAAGLVPATRLLACKQKPREVRMNAPSRLSRSRLYNATVHLYSCAVHLRASVVSSLAIFGTRNLSAVSRLGRAGRYTFVADQSIAFLEFARTVSLNVSVIRLALSDQCRPSLASTV